MPQQRTEEPAAEEEVETFEHLRQKLISLIRLPGLVTFSECTRRLPRFKDVLRAWRKAASRYVNRARAGRKVDRTLDNWIFVCWIHAGLWLYSNQDRMKCLRNICPGNRFYALLSAGAFRKRCQRLGLIGWSAFPDVYPKAPLRFSSKTASALIGERWKHFFSEGVDIINVQLKSR
jgi:hypothetical protein